VARLEAVSPTAVISSDLGRAQATARAVAAPLGVDVVADPRWRAPHVGAGGGRTQAEISRLDPDGLRALLDGDDVTLGGGDRLSDVASRLGDAFGEIADRVADGDSVVVVSHGLALMALVATLLDTTRPSPLSMMRNAAVTTFEIGPLGPQLVAYNDGSHLDDPFPVTGTGNGQTDVLLIRHGQTTANLEKRWQGHGDWPLTDDGWNQAARLAGTLPPVDALYASPLLRARDTAAAIGDAQDREVHFDDALKEIGFGSWENLTTEEIAAADPEGWRVFADGADVVRGGTGETFDSVRIRMTAAIDAIVTRHSGGTVGVVSHGGATRAYLSGVLGLSWANRHRLHTLHNTAVARFVYDDGRPRLATWNAAPHLVDER
jgi:broad specificity phosphatase PhoE